MENKEQTIVSLSRQLAAKGAELEKSLDDWNTAQSRAMVNKIRAEQAESSLAECRKELEVVKREASEAAEFWQKTMGYIWTELGVDPTKGGPTLNLRVRDLVQKNAALTAILAKKDEALKECRKWSKNITCPEGGWCGESKGGELSDICNTCESAQAIEDVATDALALDPASVEVEGTI